MNVLEMIQFLIEVEEHTGKRPTTLFVGYREHEMLKDHVSQLIGSPTDEMEDNRVTKFWGAAVKYVSIKSYVAAGWSHDEFRQCIKETRSNRT